MLTFSAFASRNSASGKVMLVARRGPELGVSAIVASILEAIMRMWSAYFNLRHRSDMAPDPKSMPSPPWRGLPATATFRVAAMPAIAPPTARPATKQCEVSHSELNIATGFTCK
jgi:hypothetical protein